MFWTRRWGIIGCVAVAQLAVVVCYQAMLCGGPPPVSAQTIVVAETEPQRQLPPVPMQENPAPVSYRPIMPVPNVKNTSVPGPEMIPTPIPVPVRPEVPGIPQLPPGPAELPFDLKNAAALPPMGGSPVPAFPSVPDQCVLDQYVPGEFAQGIMPVAAQEQKPIAPVAPGPQAVPPPLSPSQKLPEGMGMPPPPVPTQSTKVEQPQPTPLCPWNLNVEIIDGRTQLTAMNGKEVKFTVSCDKLEVQTPGGSIHAIGKVELASDSLRGTCTQLTISWKDDVVLLDQVELKCKLEGQEAELKGQQLRLRLSRVVSVEAPHTDGRDPGFKFWLSDWGQ